MSTPTHDVAIPLAQSAAMTAADVHRTILAVWRIEQPRLITGLSRMLRDVTLAEDLTQEALVAALEHWPATGVPDKPAAWLMATAKRRALDDLRRRSMLARKHEMLLWGLAILVIMAILIGASTLVAHN